MPNPSNSHETKRQLTRDLCKPCSMSTLVRPKYFCGQLLTEEDLIAEQRYQREKDRLHNQYLHGWGVVCGLKVTCHPKCSSKGNVLIEKGYAIDCCGNDIIVCKDEELNIIDMIEECQKNQDEDECLPPFAIKKDECKGLEKKYCLILKYKEEEARPVTALKKDDEGCSVKRCEPSRIKEGYEFEVKECKDCDKKDMNLYFKTLKLRFSLLFDSPFYTYNSVIKEVEKVVTINPQNNEKYLKAFCAIKEYILTRSKTNPMVRCDIGSEICKIDFPDAQDIKTGEYKEKLKDAFKNLWELNSQMGRDQRCLNLLYPCPECKEGDEVVLACITVQGDVIKHICNLSRRDVMTFPKLLSKTPVDEIIRQNIINECCEPAPELPLVVSEVPKYPYEVITQPSLYISSFNAVKSAPLKTAGFDAGLVFDKSSIDATSVLKEYGITVKEKIDFEPTLETLSRPEIWYPPLGLDRDSEVNLYVKDDRVLFVMPHEEVEKIDVEAIRELKTAFNTLKADFNIIKSSMKRDLGSTIKLKGNIEKAYQPITIDIVRGIAEVIEPEKLKDVGDVRGKELKKAGLKSVRDVLEAVPADVSDATKEPIANATKYIDHAENLTMEVTRSVYSELKKAKITKKKDLNKMDTKSLAKKLELSERAVKKVFSDISGIK